MRTGSLGIAALLTFSAIPAIAEEDADLAKRQCRSVHLAYEAPVAQWAVLEVTATESAPGTYFCALGFSRGYLGMQELADGKKVILFSVWDSPDEQNLSDRPEDTALAKRVGVVRIGEGVREKRFGGEGTGSQSFFDHDWELGKPVRFALHSGEAGLFSGYFYDDAQRRWQLMATFRTSTEDRLKGLYSFIEDFRRDGESARKERRAVFSRTWVRDLEDVWSPVTRARFTADATPSPAIDAGIIDGSFFLQTGGSTRNEHTPLWDGLSRPTPAGSGPPPEIKDLPEP